MIYIIYPSYQDQLSILEIASRAAYLLYLSPTTLHYKVMSLRLICFLRNLIIERGYIKESKISIPLHKDTLRRKVSSINQISKFIY